MISVLTIDGPSGSGKGTVSRLVAESLGWNLLDSGALYRLVAVAALRDGVALDNTAALVDLARELAAKFSWDESGEELIWLAGVDVTAQVRTEQCGEMASKVASQAAVRDALTDLQRSYQAPPGLVADGRDMGTVIFPDAVLKIYLTASPEERAKRRHKQLKDKGIGVSLAALSREIAERDARDANRSVAPLVPAADAIMLDSTDLSVNAVIAEVLRFAADCSEIADVSNN
ncbi:MAG: (d)CMP kinase [Pseudomonadota bacterium]